MRTSTTDQQNGLEAQRHAIDAWAAREGVHVALYAVDVGVGGGSPIDARPGLLEALEALQSASMLVVHRRDRLARDVVVSALVEREAEKAGAVVVSTIGEGSGNTPEALLLRRLLDAIGEYERALIRARVKHGLASKRRRGELIGSVPLGSALADDGRTLVASPRERAAAARARDLRASGASLRAIGSTLASEGHKPRGSRWHPQSVSRLLAAGEGVR